MTTTLRSPDTPAVAGPVPVATVDLDVVVPVYDEEATLEQSVRRLHRYLSDAFPLSWRVTVVDNASRDRTWAVATALADELPGVRALHLDRKGRGRALRAAWTGSDALVVAYMDVDLSTDLDALLPLVAPLVTGHSDVAIGSRLAPGSRVVRGAKRELVSRTYNRILHLVLRNRFSDAQCGFKAVRSDVVRALLPLVDDESWFFDTELLVLAERNGLRIHEVPVDWVDDPDSRVDVTRTALDDLRGVARLLGRFARHDRVDLGELRDRHAPPSGVTAGRVAHVAGRVLSLGVLFALSFAAGAWAWGPIAGVAFATVTSALLGVLHR